MATSDEAHRAAHRRAYDIFEGVQSDQRDDALAKLPAALSQAQSHGWSDIALVLDAAAAVDVITHPGSSRRASAVGDLVDALVERAEHLGSSALHA
ncbi:MAG: hypothetical protein ACRDV3_02285, partial [Acidothermaceae bacterium]